MGGGGGGKKSDSALQPMRPARLQRGLGEWLAGWAVGRGGAARRGGRPRAPGPREREAAGAGWRFCRRG